MRWSLTACAAGVVPLIAGLCGAAQAGGMLAPIGYGPDQLANADTIIREAHSMGLGGDAAVLGVAAALGESDLRDLDYGDNAINPDGTVADSVGLFQQQHWWGSYAARMDPATASAAFYSALEAIPAWQIMSPTAAIHDVQGNADPTYYTPYVQPARELTRYLDAHPLLSAELLQSVPLPVASPSPSAASPLPGNGPTPGTSAPATVQEDIDANLLDHVGFR